MIKNILLIQIILSTFCSFGQQIYKIYQDDSLHLYFKQLGKENGFFYDIDNLKDSLSDGKYVFYDVLRKDSLSKDKNILIKGQYKDFRKVGEFVTTSYIFQKKTKTYRLDYQHICHFKEGKKNGKEEKYNFYPFHNKLLKLMIFYGEFLDGKKNGLFMYYELGEPIKVLVYKNDEISLILK